MATILIIDDDVYLSRMYEVKLRRQGFDTATARDGATGLERVRSLKPDLVVLDVIFPKFDGFAVLKQIKEDDDIRHIPVLLLTNLAQDEDIEKGKQLGALGYLIKEEITPSHLAQWIRHALGLDDGVV